MNSETQSFADGPLKDLPLSVVGLGADELGLALAKTQPCAVEWGEYASLLESARAIVWRADAATFQPTFVSKAAESILGYRQGDWLKPQEFWAERIHPEDRESVLNMADIAERAQGNCTFEHRMKTAEGRTVWLRNVVSVVARAGQPKELVGISFEVTERKQLEEELREREMFLTSVLKSLQAGLVVLDKAGVIVMVNDAWTGFAQEHGIDPVTVSGGVNYLEVCRRSLASGDLSARETLEAIEAVLNGGSGRVLSVYPCEFPTGRRWYVMRVNPLRAPQGGAVVVHGNITELKETQETLHKSLAEVEQLKNKIQEENIYLRQKARLSKDHSHIIGQSPAIQQVLRQVEDVAGTDSTVLLLGETGTGKELLAASLHELSSRRGRTLVIVNCAAMPAPLVESELFGREKGAFTGSLSRQIGKFELADGSTIFLDEIGELSPEVQAKLLRVLEGREIERLGNPKPVPINVRIIAATNRDIERAVGEGKFRQDLYYRLNVFPILVPPLRERREDIPLLIWSFVDEFAKTFNKNIQSVERASMEALQSYSWPGNVRELRNLVERAMIVATGSKLRITLPHLAAASPSASSSKLADVERGHLLSVLQASGWRIRGLGGAAEKLGLKPTTLEARMAKLSIRRPGFVSDH